MRKNLRELHGKEITVTATYATPCNFRPDYHLVTHLEDQEGDFVTQHVWFYNPRLKNNAQKGDLVVLTGRVFQYGKIVGKDFGLANVRCSVIKGVIR